MASGIGVTCFRVLLEIHDAAKGLKRTESPAVLRVSRKCLCAMRDGDDANAYDLTQTSPIEATSRLLQPKKGEYLHALVCWRSATELTLIAMRPLATDVVTKFRKFFSAETALYETMMNNDQTCVLEQPADMTPTRRTAKAADAAQALAPSTQWSQRTDFADVSD